MRLNRRGLALLGFGHLCTDVCQGAVPALLPFLAAQRGYSYAALGGLVLAATIGSSLIQPAFGLFSDRFTHAWLMPFGVLVAGSGVAVVGLVHTYVLTVAAIAVSGVGVAAFHPEGARFANLASGLQRGRGMSLFSVGGNAGFALGPLLTTPLVLVFGLPGTLGLAVPPAVAGTLLLRNLPRLRGLAAAGRDGHDDGADGARDAWGPFTRLGAVIALRSGVYFGLQAFVPAYFVAELARSETAGNTALTAMLASGAVGTLVGGELVDRLGARTVLIGSLSLLLPLLVLFPLVGGVAATLVLAGVGFCTIASFSVTIVLGHHYLPSRLGLASGVTLGLAIGMGGIAATVLGVAADAFGLTTVMWIIATLPVPALALAWSLPGARRARVAVSAAAPRA